MIDFVIYFDDHQNKNNNNGYSNISSNISSGYGVRKAIDINYNGYTDILTISLPFTCLINNNNV